jgi:hypothetical protein
MHHVIVFSHDVQQRAGDTLWFNPPAASALRLKIPLTVSR